VFGLFIVQHHIIRRCFFASHNDKNCNSLFSVSWTMCAVQYMGTDMVSLNVMSHSLACVVLKLLIKVAWHLFSLHFSSHLRTFVNKWVPRPLIISLANYKCEQVQSYIWMGQVWTLKIGNFSLMGILPSLSKLTSEWCAYTEDPIAICVMNVKRYTFISSRTWEVPPNWI